jgi:hypothetical protein
MKLQEKWHKQGTLELNKDLTNPAKLRYKNDCAGEG